MRASIRTACAACLAVLALIGCGGGGGKSGSPSIDFSDYYPLQKGTYRTYQVSATGGAKRTLTQVWTVGATYGGVTSVRTCESAIDWDDEAQVDGQTLGYRFSDQDGVVTWERPVVLGVDDWAPGQTVSTDTGAPADGGVGVVPVTVAFTYRTIEAVTTPAGTFTDAIRIDLVLSSEGQEVSRASAWYARGVGLAKSVDSDGDTWELISHGRLPAPAPALVSVDPDSGSPNGRSLIIVAGGAFQDGATVVIDERVAPAAGFIDAGSLSVVTPAGEAGARDIAVINPDCQSARIAQGFRYDDGTVPPPPIAAWASETVDDPQFFAELSPRSMALDTGGRPHVVYGGDHLYNAWHDGLTWRRETVDGAPKVGRQAAITVDPADALHVVYVDDARSTLRYATNASGEWAVETMPADPGSGVREFPSIAVDRDGAPHVAYRTPLSAHYASRASGQWEVTTIDEGTVNLGGPAGKNTAILLGPAGEVHVVYFFDTGAGLRHATNVSGAWTSQIVDGAANAFSGQFNAAALDAQGALHVSYYHADFTTNIAEVRYASNATGAWVTEPVFDAADSGSLSRSTSIALDAAGDVHIGYSDWSAGEVARATNATGMWLRETASPENGLYVSVALAASGVAHLSYFDPSARTLRYASDTTGAWVGEVLDTATGRDTPVGTDTSMALDSSGDLHVAYVDGAGDPNYGSLIHTVRTGGAWTIETLDPAGGAGASLAIDAADNLHISYGWSGGLAYVTDAGGAWVIERLVMNGTAGEDTAIAVDARGGIHIAYYDSNPSTGGLRYAGNTAGTWVFDSIDDGQGVGRYPSIALDASGHVHLAYGAAPAGVRYATNATGTWAVQTIDPVNGIHTSIAVSAAGVAHVSYHHGEFSGGLKYATNAGGSWASDVLDPGASSGQYTSIALDNAGRAHIAYYDNVHADLRHATNAYCAWVVETVDAEGMVGKHASLALDDAGAAHISYFDEGNGSLRHAEAVSMPQPVDCGAD